MRQCRTAGSKRECRSMQPCLRLVDLLLRFEHPVDRLLDGWLAIVVGRLDCAEIIYGLADVIFFTINFRPYVQARIVAVGDEEMHKFRSRRQAVASGGFAVELVNAPL